MDAFIPLFIYFHMSVPNSYEKTLKTWTHVSCCFFQLGGSWKSVK